jgi:agmatine deiminase
MKNTQLIIIIFLFLSFWSCKSPTVNESEVLKITYHMPAEWEYQEAVWLGWMDSYVPFQESILNIAKALDNIIPIKMVVDSKEALERLKKRLKRKGLDPEKMVFYVMSDSKLWMRDQGAAYLLDKVGHKKVGDFGWTLYGNEAFLKNIYGNQEDSIAHYYQLNLGKTGQIDSLMGALEGHPSIKTDVNMEGGAIEVNGNGSLILSETVTFHRNPKLSRAYIESEFKRVLGVSNIIWMKQGLAEDPCWFDKIADNYYAWGTNGHTDEFVRFANDSTVLLAWVDEKEKNLNPINKINFDRMSENLAILEQAHDQNGRPLNIIKVPLPDPMIMKKKLIKGDDHTDLTDRKKWQVDIKQLSRNDTKKVGDDINWVASSSYLNYLVTNEAVLLPTYVKEGSSPEKEQKIKQLFGSLFPNRKLIFLDVMYLNYFGGGIHCVTQQEPKSNYKNSEKNKEPSLITRRN